jgi:hypothetical protein
MEDIYMDDIPHNDMCNQCKKLTNIERGEMMFKIVKAIERVDECFEIAVNLIGIYEKWDTLKKPKSCQSIQQKTLKNALIWYIATKLI